MRIEKANADRFALERARKAGVPEVNVAKNLMEPEQFKKWFAKKEKEIRKKAIRQTKAWNKIRGGNLKLLLPSLLFAGLFGTMMENENA